MSAYATEPPVTLPDFIARAISDDGVARWNDTKAAERVLAMPEMQAVREALHDMAQEIDNWSEDGGARYVLDYKYNLPASVVAWVLDGKQ